MGCLMCENLRDSRKVINSKGKNLGNFWNGEQELQEQKDVMGA